MERTFLSRWQHELWGVLMYSTAAILLLGTLLCLGFYIFFIQLGGQDFTIFFHSTLGQNEEMIVDFYLGDLRFLILAISVVMLIESLLLMAAGKNSTNRDTSDPQLVVSDSQLVAP